MHQDNELTTRFITSSIPVKLFITHGFLLHGLSIVFTLLVHGLTLPFMQDLTGGLFSPVVFAGLLSFMIQMTTVVTVLLFMVFIYVNVKKMKMISVFLFTVYPPVMLLFSATRIVSSSLVFLVAWCAVVVVMLLHYQRFKYQECDH